eukprot:m.410863 g.410863  ORF g.410863 m.410863 type:complete len:206 (+) comp56546_c0_seq12:1225-1842(+)
MGFGPKLAQLISEDSELESIPELIPCLDEHILSKVISLSRFCELKKYVRMLQAILPDNAKLTECAWNAIALLQNSFDLYLDVIRALSRSATPTLPLLVPALDSLCFQLRQTQTAISLSGDLEEADKQELLSFTLAILQQIYHCWSEVTSEKKQAKPSSEKDKRPTLPTVAFLMHPLCKSRYDLCVQSVHQGSSECHIGSPCVGGS